MQRVWNTTFTPTQIIKNLEGGGVSLKVFDLRFLYESHKFFRNRWTHTNDGFDLAQYFGTKIYLKPHPTHDYAFVWDTDLKQEHQYDITRMHPAVLLNTKNVIFVRSQITGGNRKTKKITIRPPANILNQWKLQQAWIDIPLFQYGFVLINWKEPFFRQGDQPVPVDELTLYQYKQPGTSSPGEQNQVGYSPLVDSGNGNIVGVKWIGQQIAGTDSTNITWITWTANLPYWLTMFGQNNAMDFNLPPDPSLPVAWIFIKWPFWSKSQIVKPTGQKPSQFFLWGGTKDQMLKIARLGPFVMSSLATPETRINIPLIYKSMWRWGGTDLVQQPITALNPNPPQVSVKDPGTQFRSLLYPWDQPEGLISDRALQRITGEGTISPERPAYPFEEPTEGYAYPASSESEREETEEDEEESDQGRKNAKAIGRIRRYVQRERNKRKQFKHLIRSLVKPKTVTL